LDEDILLLHGTYDVEYDILPNTPATDIKNAFMNHIVSGIREVWYGHYHYEIEKDIDNIMYRCVRPVGHHSGRILLGRIYDVYPIAEFKVNGKVYRVCSSSGFTGRIRNHDTLNQNNTKYLKTDFEENNREVTIFYDPEDPTNANIGYTPKQRLVFARNNIFTIIACIIIALFMLSSLIATFKG
jgi:hypothetical protein